MKILLYILFVLNNLLLSYNVAANNSTYPSFNCLKATTDIEKTICNKNSLAVLDNEMSRIYRSLKPVKYNSYQLKWIKKRNRCAKEKSLFSCLKNEYEIRVKELLKNHIDAYKNTKKYCKNNENGYDFKLCTDIRGYSVENIQINNNKIEYLIKNSWYRYGEIYTSYKIITFEKEIKGGKFICQIVKDESGTIINGDKECSYSKAYSVFKKQL